MAAFAIATEFATIIIVFAVSAGTGFPHAELGLGVVLKLPEVPVIQIMATGAIQTKMPVWASSDK